MDLSLYLPISVGTPCGIIKPLPVPGNVFAANLNSKPGTELLLEAAVCGFLGLNPAGISETGFPPDVSNTNEEAAPTPGGKFPSPAGAQKKNCHPASSHTTASV